MFQMGKVKVFCFVVCILSLSKLFAQETNEISKYWVFLKDKPETQFDPHSYFDEKAIQRRLNQNLASFDWYDLPVNPSYRRIVEERVTQIKTESRWLNAFVVYANESQIESLLTLNFVKQIENAGRNELIISEESLAVDSNYLELLQRQTERMGIEYFDYLGFECQLSRCPEYAVVRRVFEANRWGYFARRLDILLTPGPPESEPVQRGVAPGYPGVRLTRKPKIDRLGLPM